MKAYKTVAKNDNEEHIVVLMKDKETRLFCWVNLTKGHVCPCRFKFSMEAMRELKERSVSVIEIDIEL